LPGSTASGLDVVEEFLEKEVGIARGTYVMKNGSGLNDTNRFSAAQTNRLLTAMVERFPLMPEYLSALGIAGKDGTVRTRFEGSDAVGRLRAKTGTLETVSALSGYVQAVGGERFVFSILVNDFSGRASTVVQHVDALGAAVAASSGTAGGPSAAVASLAWPPPSVVGSFEELVVRLTTYLPLRQKADRKNVAFLRTAVRTEKDPAVRAFLAETLYRSDPRDPSSARVFLDTAVASEDTFGRLRRAATALQLDPPVVPSLVELATGGSVDAAGRLLELARVRRSDPAELGAVVDGLAVVAGDAPQELLQAMKVLGEAELEAAEDALVEGMVGAAHPAPAFWAAVQAARGSVEPATADFGRVLEGALSRKVAAARAPPPTASGPAAVEPPVPGGGVPTPGG
jgi:D-alanyl-D-alanine carboxypeptidase/D-alanyl-D-alanine-endopeptidase (penicillin-binding protein 4)